MKFYGWICSSFGSIVLSLLITLDNKPDWLWSAGIVWVWLAAAGTLSAILEARLR